MVSPVVSLPSTASRRTRTAEYSDEEHPDDEGTKGNKKGRPVLAVVKQASLAATALLLVFTIVIVLDAYKFVSVRVSECGRLGRRAAGGDRSRGGEARPSRGGDRAPVRRLAPGGRPNVARGRSMVV